MKKDNYNYKKNLEKKALKKEAKNGFFDRID